MEGPWHSRLVLRQPIGLAVELKGGIGNAISNAPVNVHGNDARSIMRRGGVEPSVQANIRAMFRQIA